MSFRLIKAAVGLVPVTMLLFASALLFYKRRKTGPFLQMVGAICLLLVVLAHICEAVGLFPGMGWGQKHSIGHYLDLCSALIGFSLFPIGYFMHAIAISRLNREARVPGQQPR